MNSEDLPYNLDEFLADDPDFLMQGSDDFFSPHTCNPSSSLMVSDQINSTYPSNVFNLSSCDEILNRPKLPPLLPRPRPQPPPLLPRPQPQPELDIIKFKHGPPEKSKNKHVLTSCISTQDQSSKHYKQDCGDHHQHQDQRPLTPRETHNVSQRRRRDRVKEKMERLKDLIPNCNKKDMASVLDEAIKYVQLLKFQAQYYGGYQQQLQAVQQAVAWGGTQTPMMSPAASSSVQAPSHLHYPLQQQMLQYPMIVMQPTSLPPIPPISNDHVTTISTTTSAV